MTAAAYQREELKDFPELRFVPREQVFRCMYCGLPAQQKGPLLCGRRVCRDRYLAEGNGSVTSDEYKTSQDDAFKPILAAQLKARGWDRRHYVPTDQLEAYRQDLKYYQAAARSGLSAPWFYSIFEYQAALKDLDRRRVAEMWERAVMQAYRSGQIKPESSGIHSNAADLIRLYQRRGIERDLDDGRRDPAEIIQTARELSQDQTKRQAKTQDRDDDALRSKSRPLKAAGRPRGRPSLGVTPEKIIEVLTRTRNIYKAAAELKCSRGTIYGYIGQNKVKELTGK